MKDLTLSVVIPAFNEEKTIGKCLTSLKKQKVQPDKIIVVNNNSTDNTAAIARKFDVIVLQEKKQGMIPARNTGFDIVKSDIIARTDADTMVPPYWVAKIKEHFSSDDIIGVSGPAYYFDLPKGVRISYWSTNMFFRLLKKKLKTDCLFGPNMAIRRSAWEKVRNEICLKDSLVHEDIDLAVHLAHYGKIKFDPKLIVATSAQRWKKPYSYIEYSYRLAKMLRRHNIDL